MGKGSSAEREGGAHVSSAPEVPCGAVVSTGMAAAAATVAAERRAERKTRAPRLAMDLLESEGTQYCINALDDMFTMMLPTPKGQQRPRLAQWDAKVAHETAKWWARNEGSVSPRPPVLASVRVKPLVSKRKAGGLLAQDHAALPSPLTPVLAGEEAGAGLLGPCPTTPPTPPTPSETTTDLLFAALEATTRAAMDEDAARAAPAERAPTDPPTPTSPNGPGSIASLVDNPLAPTLLLDTDPHFAVLPLAEPSPGVMPASKRAKHTDDLDDDLGLADWLGEGDLA